MLKVLSSILCDLDPKVKVIGQKAGICDGVPSTSALVFIWSYCLLQIWALKTCNNDISKIIIAISFNRGQL